MKCKTQVTTPGLEHHGDDHNGNQFLTFLLAGEEYGVDILKVQEIKGLDGVTEIPNTPAYVLGVINLRGTVIPHHRSAPALWHGIDGVQQTYSSYCHAYQSRRYGAHSRLCG